MEQMTDQNDVMTRGKLRKQLFGNRRLTDAEKSEFNSLCAEYGL